MELKQQISVEDIKNWVTALCPLIHSRLYTLVHTISPVCGKFFNLHVSTSAEGAVQRLPRRFCPLPPVHPGPQVPGLLSDVRLHGFVTTTTAESSAAQPISEWC